MIIEKFASFDSISRRQRIRHGAACAAGAVLTAALVAGCGSGSDTITVNVPNSVAVADVNGDGAPDLLVATTADQGNTNNPGFAAVILGNPG